MEKPKFKHPLNSKEGRIERAVWTFLDGEKRGILVGTVVGFLKDKGCSDEEVAEALLQAVQL